MRLKNFYVSEYLVVFWIIVLSLFTSIYPTLDHLIKTPSGLKFSLAYNYIPDYYHYISWMRDGADGHLSISTRYTAESFPRRFAYILYPILGFMSSRIGLNFFYGYFLARIVLGALGLVLIYFLISLLIKDRGKRIASFLVTILLPSFSKPDFSSGHLSFKFFLEGITNFDVFRRLTFIPHHTLAQILTIFFFVFLYKGLKRDNKIFSLLAGFFLMTAIILNPAVLIYMSGVMALAFVLLVAVVFREKIGRLVIHFVLFSLPVFLAIIYYKFYLFTAFPFDILSQNENSLGTTWSIVDTTWTATEYLGALGPAVILAMIAITSKKLEKNILYLLLLSWAVGPIALYFIFKHFFNSYILIFRLFQAELFVPLGILGAMGLISLWERIKNRFFQLAMIGLVIAVSVPYYFISFKYQMEEMPTSSYNVYIPDETINAFSYLEKNTPDESVVLAGYYMAEILPAYTHNRVYLSRPDLTYRYDEKIKLFTKFFSKQMTFGETEDFLKNGKISYILFGPDTPSPPDNLADGNIVTLLYKDGGSLVYKVN